MSSKTNARELESAEVSDAGFTGGGHFSLVQARTRVQEMKKKKSWKLKYRKRLYIESIKAFDSRLLFVGVIPAPVIRGFEPRLLVAYPCELRVYACFRGLELRLVIYPRGLCVHA